MDHKIPCSRILLNTDQLSGIVSRLARDISAAYPHQDHSLALVVLEGARYFANDLLKQLHPPIDTAYIKASSYSGVNSTGNVIINTQDWLKETIHGKNILLIDDIYDSGLTLWRILDWLRECGASSVQTCVLLEKQINHTKDITIDFLGTPVADEFIIGYGLDYNGRYRDLPYIGVAAHTVIQEGANGYKP